jgi:O-antigen/teichoic acid export membrane protein
MGSFTRGTFLLMAAQGVFMLSGYVLNVFLARYFGPEIYGQFGVAMAVLVWVEFFVINGVPTAMQKFLSEASNNTAALVRLGRRLQLGYALAIFAFFMAVTPLVSAGLRDPALKQFLWIAAPDIVLYGLYWFYLGVHSGLHRFESQAFVIICYALSKVTCSIGLVLLGAGISGALIGNFGGSAAGLVIGALLLRKINMAPATTAEHYSRFTKFAVPVILYTLSINALLYIDLLFVKHSLPAAAAGYYTAAATIARAPYFIFLGLASTVLPALSRTLAQENLEAARNLLRHTMRLLFGLLVPVLILITANADHLVELLYSRAYDSAIPILQLLIMGIAMYTLLVVLCTIMSADGHPHLAFHISLGAAVIDVPLCLIFVPKWGAQGAATATLIASTLGVMAAGTHVLKRFGSIFPWRSLLRTAIAGTAILGLALWWRSMGWMLLVELALLFGVYFLVLYVLGELKHLEIVRK